MTKIRVALIAVVIGVLIGVAVLIANRASPSAVRTVRLLAWVGYDEPDLLAEFQQRTGIKVNVDTFIGGSQMLARLRGDPGAFDVVVLDPEFIALAAGEGLLEPLGRSEVDFSHYHPFFKDRPEIVIDDSLYAMPVRFGIVGVMYNTEHVSSEVAGDLGELLKARHLHPRISMMDLWQPVLGLLARHQTDLDDPYQATPGELARIRESILSLRDAGAKIHESVPDLLNSLADGDSWIMLGGGEANTVSLLDRGKPFDWLVPKQGGILWMESLGLVRSTPNRVEAIELIRYLQSPEGQARIARRATYISSPPSITAAELLSSEERRVRHIETRERMDALLSSVTVRHLPPAPSIVQWELIWEEAKQR